MRDDKVQTKQSLEAARQIGAAEKDSSVDKLRLKLGMRSGERPKAGDPMPNGST
jgi:hypothetical protein